MSWIRRPEVADCAGEMAEGMLEPSPPQSAIEPVSCSGYPRGKMQLAVSDRPSVEDFQASRAQTASLKAVLRMSSENP